MKANNALRMLGGALSPKILACLWCAEIGR